MPRETITTEVNSNFHHIAGENLFEQGNSNFIEYRKKWKEWPEKSYAGEFPLFIDIEVSSACNLKCPFCATTFRGRLIEKGFMSLDIFRNIIDEGAENNLYGVKLNIRGEPLLHSKINEFVRYAKKKGLIDVYLNTNGMLLEKEMARKLINAGLDRISISFEGYTKEVYEAQRVGSSYERVLANIENIQNLKKKLCVFHPKIRIQTVMLPDIEPTFQEYKRFWSDRVEEVAYLDYKEMKIKKRGIKYPWACPQIWQRMAIWWDGTILPCNHDDGGLISLGNVRKVSIKDAWQSEKLERIRDFHKRGLAHEISACNGCYLRDSEILKLQRKKN